MRPRNATARHSLAAALRRGPVGAVGLARALGISARSVLRLLGEAGDAVIGVGSASRRRYAGRHALRGERRPLPLYEVDREGRVSELAALDLIEPSGCQCTLGQAGWPVDEAARDGLWESLPYPLYDMQPQGFLGRSFARREQLSLEVAEDPRDGATTTSSSCSAGVVPIAPVT